MFRRVRNGVAAHGAALYKPPAERPSSSGLGRRNNLAFHHPKSLPFSLLGNSLVHSGCAVHFVVILILQRR